MKAQAESRVTALLFNLGARCEWVVNATPRPLYPRNLWYRRRGWPHRLSGRVRKNSPQPGFDARTVQPVASRYTNYAIPSEGGNKLRSNINKHNSNVSLSKKKRYLWTSASEPEFRRTSFRVSQKMVE